MVVPAQPYLPAMFSDPSLSSCTLSAIVLSEGIDDFFNGAKKKRAHPDETGHYWEENLHLA
jgi:hypothetical protein